jgi:uncharacterized protein YbjT (DUF2867 family)
MTTVLVTGGTGMLGRHVVTTLIKNGHIARIMSRARQPDSLVAGTEWAWANLENGQGISEAVRGVGTIIHAATSPFRRMQQVDLDGSRLLIEQACAAGVSHVIYISILGIDRIPLSYYRYKLAAEEVITRSGLPWSILRATQFHSFVDLVLKSLTKMPLFAFLPTDLQCQPVYEKEVANCLGEIVDRGPSARLPDLAGPEVLTLGQLAYAQLKARGIQRAIIPFRLPGKAAQGFRSGYNTCPTESLQGKVTWSEWLQRTYQEK